MGSRAITTPHHLTIVQLTRVAGGGRFYAVWGGESFFFAADFFTAAVWCVPFSGTVGLFNKLQTHQNKKVVMGVTRGRGCSGDEDEMRCAAFSLA